MIGWNDWKVSGRRLREKGNFWRMKRREARAREGRWVQYPCRCEVGQLLFIRLNNIALGEELMLGWIVVECLKLEVDVREEIVQVGPTELPRPLDYKYLKSHPQQCRPSQRPQQTLHNAEQVMQALNIDSRHLEQRWVHRLMLGLAIECRPLGSIARLES